MHPVLLRKAALKTALYLGVFVALHYSYEWYPAGWLRVFSADSECFIQHAKIGMFAWLLSSLVEYAGRRRQLARLDGLLYSRMAAVVLLPWLMFLIYYIGPAFYGKPMPNDAIETVYAILCSILLGLLLGLLELEMETYSFSKFTRWLIAALFLLSFALMISFTYRVPWAGFFVE